MTDAGVIAPAHHDARVCHSIPMQGIRSLLSWLKGSGTCLNKVRVIGVVATLCGRGGSVWRALTKVVPGRGAGRLRREYF